MARMVATKTALSVRLDALADADSKSTLDSATIGIDNRVKLEARLRQRKFFRPALDVLSLSLPQLSDFCFSFPQSRPAPGSHLCAHRPS